MSLFDLAESPSELYAVDDRATRTLRELHAVKDGITDESVG
ncbi:MAG: hypothetical protein ACR2JC_09800 [Chloroflexota bacterium]